MNDEHLLRVKDVGWRAGSTTVLERVTVDVAAGEFVAVMGRNGAGKSTLLDIIAGLKRPSSGAVVIAQTDLSDWAAPDRARVVTHLPQSLRADLAMRAEALVLMGRYAHQSQWFESAADLEIAHGAMQQCDCLQYRDRMVGTLSGGERQRVFLAACLSQRPKLLLLDEPTTFLDIDQQLHTFTVLRDEVRRGTACLAVTHDLNLALRFCTRLIVLADRKVAYDVSIAQAVGDSQWLQAFSDRLRIEQRSTDGAWVTYR